MKTSPRERLTPPGQAFWYRDNTGKFYSSAGGGKRKKGAVARTPGGDKRLLGRFAGTGSDSEGKMKGGWGGPRADFAR